jgi:hypothetical protein
VDAAEYIKLEDAIYRISCCEREKKEEPQNFKFQMQEPCETRDAYSDSVKSQVTG